MVLICKFAIPTTHVMQSTILIIFLFFLAFPNCRNKDDLKIISAKCQSFTGGLVNSASGNTYSIVMQTNHSSKHLKIHSIWITYKYYKSFDIRKNILGAFPNILDKNDEIILTLKKNTNDTISDKYYDRNELTIPAYKGVALIEYSVQHKKKLLSIDNFEQLPTRIHQ